MPITQLNYNDHMIVAIKGRLDARFIHAQREVLEQLPKQINSTVLFDLSNIDFIDSSGIGFLVYVFKRVKPQKHIMVILGLKGQPKDTVKMLHIDRMINCVDSLDEFEQQIKSKKTGTRREALKKVINRRRFVKKTTTSRVALKRRAANR